ncbi:uncharacterized protein SCHCODRAFT_02507097 [Schizophyllum commune H4-8]|uniref:uncharacterized protein n=1 Tax=Schizophyllum commune (strain H4-8 / FGSC 9210) TaxID=578458 RepID=UPI00216005CE|nr:uncharacterized protein SCHCODRAFT_02507097 [Schizophyllum commune H4-8]KAI5890066.1 hypothetical protein SCHCODRAFT_02507097 [Schizophyllum commune H4-8]
MLGRAVRGRLTGNGRSFMGLTCIGCFRDGSSLSYYSSFFRVALVAARGCSLIPLVVLSWFIPACK